MEESADEHLATVRFTWEYASRGAKNQTIKLSTPPTRPSAVATGVHQPSQFCAHISDFLLASGLYHTTLQGISLNPITSLYYVAPCCLAFLVVPWAFVELPRLLAVGIFQPDFFIFGTNSLCAFALNLAVFLLVGKTSALTMNVAGVVKDWLLIAFSWSVIRDTVTPINLFGYGIAFLGVGYYNHVKLQALKAKEAQKKAAQADEEAGSLLQERDSHGDRKSDNQA
ncbi:hypothetical protein ABZP36_027613 [Zizania latifolia]